MRTALSLLGWSLMAGVIVGCGSSTPEAVAPDGSAPESVVEAATPAPPPSPTTSSAFVAPASGEEPLGEPVDIQADGSEQKTGPASKSAPTAMAPAPASASRTVVSEDSAEVEVSRGGGTGVGRGGMAPKPSLARPAPMPTAQAGGVRAGEWDDNANFREFSHYLAKKQSEVAFAPLALEVRRFVVVSDAKGKAVPNCAVRVTDRSGREVLLTTPASGRALLFPRAEGLVGSQLQLRAECQGQQVTASAELRELDGVVKLSLAKARSLPAQRTVDVVFIVDTTGSMSEEISALKSTIAEVAASLRRQNARPRLGLVEYKDIEDSYVTRLHQMTTDVDGFSARVAELYAEGGGDLPEHVNAGLRVAVDRIQWNPDSVARLAFLIGDAPPQLDYEQDVSYTTSVKNASHKGIQIFTIAASGMDDGGQVVWRQIAQYTGGTNMFVLRGGAGPQSTGAGDAEKSCGGTHKNYSSGNLAELIAGKVAGSLTALDDNPMRIAGLGGDENAKPCAERLTLAR